MPRRTALSCKDRRHCSAKFASTAGRGGNASCRCVLRAPPLFARVRVAILIHRQLGNLLDRRYRYREGGRLAAQLLMDGDTGLGAGGGSAVARDYEAEPSASGFSAREFIFAIGLLLSLVEVPVKV